jgi:uncharacterized protein (DUF362 family)
MKAKISLIKSQDHTKGVERSLELIGKDLQESLSSVRSLVIKINMVDARRELTCTPFSAVKSFIDYIAEFYKGKIIIAESSTWGKTKEGFQKWGFTRLAEGNPQIRLLDLRDDETILRSARAK